MSSKLSCARCHLPIPKGTLYTERKDGAAVHWRCTMGALGDLLEAPNGAGTPIGFGTDPPLRRTSTARQARTRAIK